MTENTVRKEGFVGAASEGASRVQEAITEFEAQVGGRGEKLPFPGFKKGANEVRKRSVLGRGLSALMSTEAVNVNDALGAPAVRFAAAQSEPSAHESREIRAFEAAPAEVNAHEGGLVFLTIDRVLPNKAQPREHFAEDEIARLAQSIRDTGLLQPIIVRKSGSESGQLASYEIVAGERRFRAAKIAGLQRIPAILRQLSDREALELGIVENVQRENLNPIEEARAYRRLIAEFGATQEEVAESVGKDRVSVANALRLLKLPEAIQQLLIHGILSSGHGRALLMFDSEESQLKAAKVAQTEGLSVRELEAMAKEGTLLDQEARTRVTTKQEKAPEVLELEQRLRRALSTKVTLRINKRGKGELRVSFFSQEELERIIEKVL